MSDLTNEETFAVSLANGGNAVLEQLTETDLIVVARFGTRRSFDRGETMVSADTVAPQVFFIEEGIASTVKPDRSGRGKEVCLIGPEGFVGAPVFLGDAQCPYDTFAQSDRVIAWAVDSVAIRELFERNLDVRRVILRAVYLQAVQIAENLVSASSQAIQVRLARWLLMYHDRSTSAFLEVTHEFMAVMIGAQRARVTVALHELEAAGAISASRGRIVVKQRETLERLSDGTYGTAESEAIRLRRSFPVA